MADPVVQKMKPIAEELTDGASFDEMTSAVYFRDMFEAVKEFPAQATLDFEWMPDGKSALSFLRR